MKRLDVTKIKYRINLMAAALREHRQAFKQAQREKRESFNIAPDVKPGNEEFWKCYQRKVGKLTFWRWSQLAQDYTNLCALRAHMRGKLHFCPRTKEETAEEFMIGWPITLETQAEWVEDLAKHYELKEDVRAAG